MKAVIMAGGEGSRLRPLTCDLPKPMARLCGRPVLEYILELLGSHGVKEAALTLRYLPDRITDHFAQGEFAGVRLEFVEETEPLGTAGGVKNACDDGDDTVLVISGDAMCDFDLSAFIAHHRATGADVTILGKRVDDPREYGLIVSDEVGRITGFIEKPAFSQAVSDSANTGIYLLSQRTLSMIPSGRPFDFAKDLFPMMLEQGMHLSCWEGEGYWCDIGDLESYIRCQQDMLHGRVDCRIIGEQDAQGNIFAGQAPHTRVIIQPPVYVGRHVRLEEGVLLEDGSVIDDGCFVGAGARISSSILLPDSYVARRAKLTGALLCAGSTVKDGAMLFEGSTLGAGSMVGERAAIHAGVKVWNQKQVPASTVVMQHVKTSGQMRDFFDDNGISGKVGVELTPEFCARLGSAIGSVNPEAQVAVGRSPHAASSVLGAALCAGIRSTGADVVDFGENFQTQFEFSMNFCGLPIGVFLRADNSASVKVMSEGGLPATRSLEREIEGILSRGEFTRRPHDQMGAQIEMPGLDAMYQSQLMRRASRGLSGCTAEVKCSNLALKDTLRDVLYKLGCDVSSGGITLEISAQGDKVRLYSPELGYVRHHNIFAWCCLGELERGQDIAVPYDAPRLIDELAQEMGRKALRYYTCPADDSDMEARRLARNQLWSRDGLMQAVMFLAIARRAGSVETLIRRMPKFERTVRTIETEGSPAGLMRELRQEPDGKGGVGEGIVLQDERGAVLVRPLKRGTGIKIFAESVNAEIANELCDDVERLLRERLEE